MGCSHRFLSIIFVVFVALLPEVDCWAISDAMKKPCANCHTIHDSSGGAGQAVDPKTAGLIGPQESLLNYTCSGCHTGINDGAATTTPYVVDFGGGALYNRTGTEPPPGRNTLAGGNFYWATSDPSGLTGHDVEGLSITQNDRYAPGDSVTLWGVTKPLRCAGTNGCHGDPTIDSQVKSIHGAHHQNVYDNPVPVALRIDGSTTARSYRFLDGIVGWEDNTWEYTVTAATHNQYKGVVRSGDVAADPSSISFLCARCHSDFHNGNGTDAGIIGAAGTFTTPWIRHPVDIDMGPLAVPGSEYENYGGGGGAYNVATPLASTDVSAALSAVTLNAAGNNAIITCITCHRGHGSPWNYSLRWKYQTWPDAADADAYNGCGDCHSAKN